MADASFTLYSLTEEHELLRASVRDLALDRIAPRAAEIDEQAEYPWDVHKALKDADLLAIHVPEVYGGAGADKIAHSIVVEEIARVCASSSLIPMGNKLGTTGLILSGSEELKKTYLPAVAAGHEALAVPAINSATIDALRELDEPGSSELVRHLVGSFLESADDSLARVAAAASDGDSRTLAQGAHSLKSSAANLGADALAACYKTLETLGREGRLIEARVLIDRTRHEQQRALRELHELRELREWRELCHSLQVAA